MTTFYEIRVEYYDADNKDSSIGTFRGDVCAQNYANAAAIVEEEFEGILVSMSLLETDCGPILNVDDAGPDKIDWKIRENGGKDEE